MSIELKKARGLNKNLNKKEENKEMGIVCFCKMVTKEEIIEAIQNGAVTLADIKKVTGAATGACHGTRCSQTIERLIREYYPDEEWND